MKTHILILLTLFATLPLTPDLFAQKKGGGGKGGGDGSTRPYQLVQLPGLDDGHYVAECISNRRVDDSSHNGSIYVAGTSDTDVKCCLWRVDADDRVADAVVLSPVLHYVRDVNCLGMVAGAGYDGDQAMARVVFPDYSPEDPTTWVDLNTHGFAMALTDPDENNVVRVVGVKHVDHATDVMQGMQWDIDATTGMVLDTVELNEFGLGNARPYACNNQGDLAGWQSPGAVVDETDVWGPFVAWWTDEGTLAYEYLPESVPQTFTPVAIDDGGNIVGRDAFPDIVQCYFVSAAGAVVNLSAITGADVITAADVATVSGNPQVVGEYWNKRRDVAGYVWKNGQFIDLNQLLGTSDVFVGGASGINSEGAICGTAVFGSRRNQVQDGYLLIPTP